jgi:hypothetical protein
MVRRPSVPAWRDGLSPIRAIGKATLPASEAELKALRRGVMRGTPYGSDARLRATAKKLGLKSALRPRDRPRKPP